MLHWFRPLEPASPPIQKQSIIQKHCVHLLQCHQWAALFELYLKSGQSARLEVLQFLRRADDLTPLLDYCRHQPKHYLSHFWLAYLADRQADIQVEWHYEQAFRLQRDDKLLIWQMMQQLCRHQAPLETIVNLYQHGLSLKEDHFLLHQQMMMWLRHQSADSPLAFLSPLRSKLTSGDPSLALIPLAHVLVSLEKGEEYLERFRVKRDIRKAHQGFKQKRARTPLYFLASHSFLFALMQIDDKRRGREEWQFLNGYLDPHWLPCSLVQSPLSSLYQWLQISE